MVFQFEHMDVYRDFTKVAKKSFKLSELKQIFTKCQKGLEKGGWNSLYWNNHDQARVVSRFGNDKEYWEKSAKMLGTCLYMQQGTPYIYQGEEIGMVNVAFESLEDYRDIAVINGYKEEIEIKGRDPRDFMQYVYDISRDNARTSIQWDNSKMNVGFTL